MRCDKCQEDFSFWTEMVTNTYQLLGHGGKLYPTKRCTCKKCAEVYLNLEKQSIDSVRITEDLKVALIEINNKKLIKKGCDVKETLVYRSTIRPNMKRYYENLQRKPHYYTIKDLIKNFPDDIYVILTKIKRSKFW